MKKKIRIFLFIGIFIFFTSTILFIGFQVLNYMSITHNNKLISLSENYLATGDYFSAQLLCDAVLIDDPYNTKAQKIGELIGKLKEKKENSTLQDRNSPTDNSDKILRELESLHYISTLLQKIEKKSNIASPVIPVISKEPNDSSMAQEEIEIKDENTLAACLSEGLYAYREGDMQRAKAYFQNVLKIEENEATANILLAEILYSENPYEDKNLERVIQLSKKGIEQEPKNKIAYLTLGNAYESTGAFELALQNYLEVLRIDDENSQIHMRVGKLYFEIEKYIDAALHFKRAIEIKNDLASAYYYMGIIARKQGAQQASIQNLEQAVFYDNSFYAAFIELGDLYCANKSYEKAGDCFKKAYLIRKSFVLALKIGNCYEQLNDDSAAVSIYRSALHEFPLIDQDDRIKGSRLYCFLCRNAFDEGNLEAAGRLLKNAVDCYDGIIEDDEYLELKKLLRKEK